MEPELTYMDNLILSGALQVAGIDENGQFSYQFTEKLEEVDPNLKNRIEQSFYEAVMYLWNEGFLFVGSSGDDGEAIVTATEKCLDDSMVANLSEYYQRILALIVEALQK